MRGVRSTSMSQSSVTSRAGSTQRVRQRTIRLPELASAQRRSIAGHDQARATVSQERIFIERNRERK